MTTKTKPERNGIVEVGVAAKRVTVKGRRMVMLEEAEFVRLLQKADEWEPADPELLPSGNYPAIETIRVIQARSIIRDRRRLGLSQADLARRAGIRQETLIRVEQGLTKPNVQRIDKIERALKEREKEIEASGK